jgi:hypothetical protein
MYTAYPRTTGTKYLRALAQDKRTLHMVFQVYWTIKRVDLWHQNPHWSVERRFTFPSTMMACCALHGPTNATSESNRAVTS